MEKKNKSMRGGGCAFAKNKAPAACVGGWRDPPSEVLDGLQECTQLPIRAWLPWTTRVTHYSRSLLKITCFRTFPRGENPTILQLLTQLLIRPLGTLPASSPSVILKSAAWEESRKRGAVCPAPAAPHRHSECAHLPGSLRPRSWELGLCRTQPARPPGPPIGPAAPGTWVRRRPAGCVLPAGRGGSRKGASRAQTPTIPRKNGPWNLLPGLCTPRGATQ